MRGTQVVAGLVVLALGIGAATLWWTTSSPERPVVPARAPTPPPVRPRDEPIDPSLPLGEAKGPRCDPDDAGRILKALRGSDAHVRRKDHVTLVPRAMLDRDQRGMLFQVALDAGEPAGLQLASMAPDSVAADLDFRLLDVLGDVDGRPVRRVPDLVAEVDRFRERGIACTRVWRKGRWTVRWFVLEEG